MADRNKHKQKNALFFTPGKKKKKETNTKNPQPKTNNKTINSFIKVRLSGYTMIHHVNKITAADFQTVAGFSHGKI